MRLSRVVVVTFFAVAALSGCGPSRLAIHYASVAQVVRAFGRHGIPLHRFTLPAGSVRGIVNLRDPRRHHFCRVLVLTPGAGPRIAHLFVQTPRPKLPSWERYTRYSNLIVYYPARDARIRAAITTLRP